MSWESASQSPYGHVEIKTNKKTCGKDKDEACFCSDFCESRTGENAYETAGYKVQKAFVLDDEVLKHMNKIMNKRNFRP